MKIDNFINHWITGKALQSKVFETWYYDITLNKWTLDRPNVKVCDYKHVEYYFIDGKRYESIEEAKTHIVGMFALNQLLKKNVKKGNTQIRSLD